MVPMRATNARFDPSLLRLVLITDGRGDLARIESIVTAALAGGVRCVQLREPQWSARHLMQGCERLMPRLERVGGLLLVNDRLDVAAARMAHGAQIGHRSLPPEVARELLGPNAPLGYSAHDHGELEVAARGGCDFALLSPVWPTSSKPGAPHLGELRARQLTARTSLPLVWLGGISAATVAHLATLPALERPAGVAVRSAVMHADDPGEAAAALLRSMLPSAAG